jgi:Mg/Co/Ni transporter MgtE
MKAQGRWHHVLSMVRYLGPHVQLTPNNFVVNVERKLEGIVRSRLIVGAELKTAPCSFGSYDVEG